MRALTAQQKALVAEALPKARALAASFARRLRGVSEDDLKSVVHEELLQAVTRMDPTKSPRLLAYAYRGVVGAMLDAAAKERREAAWKLAGSFLRTAASEEPREDEDRLEIPAPDDPTPSQIASNRTRSRAAAIVSRWVLEPRAYGSEDEVHHRIHHQRSMRVVARVLGESSEDVRQLVVLLYVEGVTLAEAGQALGMHPKKVQRMHADIRAKLTEAMLAEGLATSQGVSA